MKLSDHIKITIHRDGIATVDADLDKFMEKISREIERLMGTNDKLDRDAAEALFAQWVGAHHVKTMMELSDENFNEFMAEVVKKFGNPQGPSHEELDAKAIASGGVGGIPVILVDDDDPQD